MALVQTDRAGRLITPLGDDVLALSHMNVTEGLSELFEVQIDAVSERPNIDFNAALGLGATVKILAANGAERYFNGVLTDARSVGARQDLFVYRLVLRPWLWLLRRSSDCRIFPSMSPVDIIKKVFSGRGDFKDVTTQSYPTLEYCVQYRETDFNFVCRLMEHFGIYYYFDHDESTHTLFLADSKSSHKSTPGLATVKYSGVQSGGRQAEQQLNSWIVNRSFQTGVYSLQDYGYKKPPAKLIARSENSGGYAQGDQEIFDYGFSYVDTESNDLVQNEVGEAVAKYRNEAVQSLDYRRSATGSAASLFAGSLVTLTENPADSENQEYLVTRCSHFVESQTYRSGGGGGGRPYEGNYQFTPSTRQFRAPLVTHKPSISGVQSALVVGKSGEEIDVDELGRILVQFYWDRKKMPSRRVRVAQTWAGKTRGALFLPRIGDEVMVVFEEGDPDRPLVIGSVYNGTNTVPLSLPDKKTKSGILTQSSKGGDGYHMLLFDDTAGSESVKLRSQKDLLMKALNNETLWIGADQSETIIGNIKQSVGQDKTVTVGDHGGGNYTMTAQKKIVLTVGPSSITIDPNGVTIKAPTITFKADVSLSASAPSVSVTGDAEVDITSPHTSISG